MDDHKIVGRSYPRKDGIARVTGQERYTCRRRLWRGACGNATLTVIPERRRV